MSGSSTYYSENEMSHYGVPGMKWGVRKDRRPERSSIGRSRSRKKRGGKLHETEAKPSRTDCHSKRSNDCCPRRNSCGSLAIKNGNWEIIC